MADMGWSAHAAAEEAANYGACAQAAEMAGIDLSLIDLENCDDGSYGCPACPWKKPKKDQAPWKWSADKTWAVRKLSDGIWVAATRQRILELPGHGPEIAHGPTRDDAIYNLGYEFGKMDKKP